MAYMENIRVFVRVFQLGNLSVTARDMRLSPAVVSNRIKELEKYLKVRLFNRTTRQIVPTKEGEVFFQRSLKVLEAVDEAEASLAQLSNQPHGSLRIVAPLGLGRRIIAPGIPEFHDKYPDLQVRVRLTNLNIDIMKEGIDVAFRLGEIEDSSFRMRGILDCKRMLCAAPSYLKKRGSPKNPDDLVSDHHDCLLLRYAGSKEYFWTLNIDGKFRNFHVEGPYDCDDGDVLADWALAGRGIVNRPLFEVQQYIKDGSLVPVLKDYPPSDAKLAAIYPHKHLQDPKVRLLIDFMADRCRKMIGEILD